jgi:hypothetical protein
MPAISDNQKRLASQLLAGSQSPNQLQAATGLSYSVIEKELKTMLKAKLIERVGTSDAYRLAPSIAAELNRRKQISEKDPHPWRIKAFVEIQAIEESLLRKETDKFTQSMTEDKRLTIYEIRIAPFEKKDDYYGTYIETNFSVQNFTSLAVFCFLYGPSAIEVIKPDQITISSNDLQDALVFLSDMAHKYSNAMVGLMNRQELEKFYQDAFEK